METAVSSGFRKRKSVQTEFCRLHYSLSQPHFCAPSESVPHRPHLSPKKHVVNLPPRPPPFSLNQSRIPTPAACHSTPSAPSPARSDSPDPVGRFRSLPRSLLLPSWSLPPYFPITRGRSLQARMREKLNQKLTERLQVERVRKG